MSTPATVTSFVEMRAVADQIGEVPRMPSEMARGMRNWAEAHKVCQGHEDLNDVNWVHAHLHRQEGDLRNAGGWYKRAGKAMPSGELQEEWTALAEEFLNKA